MTYVELLQQGNWHSKCNEILNRDHYICKHCGKIGYHNGGNYIEIKNVEEASDLFKNYTFFDKSFTDFYKWMEKQEETLRKVRVFEMKYSDYWEKEYDDCDCCHFMRPIIKSSADIDSFPFVVPKKIRPSKIIQITLNWGIKRINELEPCGELFEFIFPENIMSNNYLCIEEYDYGHYITLQFENKLFAMIFASRLKLFKGLNIHHKYYIAGHKPWEYDNDALLTLCEDCHKNWHLRNPIYVYDNNHNSKCVCNVCDRCGGSGFLPQYHYVQNGVCFKCGGEGVIVEDIV